jgi:hypothetical protein
MAAEPDDLDLSEEQRDTTQLLHHLLGQTFADRYVDFCRLAGGTLPLRVSRPLAAHALREFESSLRTTLKTPAELQSTTAATEEATLQPAAQALRELGFDEAAIQRAVRKLPAPQHHRAEIIGIVDWLGLAPDGEVANSWISLNKGAGRAHERSFHESLLVDDEFRIAFQQPFELLVREVALALQRRYSALMRRVEELAAMPDKARAVSLFQKEIPGALPLQWHFFQRLDTPDWLPHLASKRLLTQPGANVIARFPFGPWPAGSYLLRMAASSDYETRRHVATAVRSMEEFTRPDTRYTGIEILAALPPAEATPFAAAVAHWLNRDARYMSMHVPERLLTGLAEASQHNAALTIARALLQVFNEDGDAATLYPRHMYEYSLPNLVTMLARTCGLDALVLVMDLLRQTVIANGKLIEEPFTDHTHFTFRPIADDEFAAHDLYSALISAVRTCAELLIQADPGSTNAVVRLLNDASLSVCKRIAMHVLAKNPAAAPELAQAWLTDVDLIEDSTYGEEYATLARAWYPSLSPDAQKAVLDAVRAIPGRYRDGWKARREQQGQPVSIEDERMFDALVIRDALRKWRAVLPPNVQAELDETARKYENSDAPKHVSIFPREESPLQASDFSTRPIAEIVTFLQTWQPGDESPSESPSALAYQWRVAVQQDPARYAAIADQFASVPPIYVDHLLEGLDSAAKNQSDFAWTTVLELIAHVFSHIPESVDSSGLVTASDTHWLQAGQSASELLKSGLRRGADSIGYEHATPVRNLVFMLLEHAPCQPETEDFEGSFTRDAFFATQATLRGSAVELCLLWLFWLSKHNVSPIAIAPRAALTTLPDIARAFEAQLADRSPTGRIPRAILGRYLGWLFHFGADWTRGHLDQILPEPDEALRRAAWSTYLIHGGHPVKEFYPELQACYVEEMTHLAAAANDQQDTTFRHRQFAMHLLVLYLTNTLQISDALFKQFLDVASSQLKQYVMWCVGQHLQLPPDQFPREDRNRALAYWNARLAAATGATEQDSFREELETIGQWVSNPQLETDWLLDQLLEMLHAGFSPDLAFNVVEWLSNVCTRDASRPIRILAALVDNPHPEPATYLTQQNGIRKILIAAFATQSPELVDLANRTISILSTKGQTGYLDLEQHS